jgi:cell division protein WhiA
VSLSEELRDELAGVTAGDERERLAELSGLFHAAGSVHLRGRGEVTVHVDVSSSAVTRRAFRLLRSLGVAAEIRTYRRRAFDRATRYQLHVLGSPRGLQVLHEAGVLDARLAPLERPPRRVVSTRGARAAYLRGALLGAGSLSGPQGPHLEIRASSIASAGFLAEIAGMLGARLAVYDRGRHAVAYAKGRETIEDVLAAAGASGTVLALEERSVVGETRARANRLANADHANLVRTSKAAHEQLRAIRALEREGRLAQLGTRLVQAAELRRRHPSAPLSDLAARCDPPATKAAVHRRLRRLVELADL